MPVRFWPGAQDKVGCRSGQTGWFRKPYRVSDTRVRISPPPPKKYMKNSQITIGGAVVFKDSRRKRTWFVVRQGQEAKWEIPKVTVRRGESSVRSVLRLTGEMAGMGAKGLEEAGRSSGIAMMNGKSIPQKFYYYLLEHKSGDDFYGFEDYQWMEYSKALKTLELKREKDMLRSAKEVLQKWEKERQKKG